MNRPEVCLRCSRRFLRWQCQRRSSGFVSLGQLVGRDGDRKTTSQDVPLANSDPTTIEKPRRKKRLTFAQSYREQRKPKGVDKVLETLFASNRENDQALNRSRYSRTPKVQSAKPAAIETLEIERSREDRLREVHNKLLQGTAPFQDIWRDCQVLLSEKNWHIEDNVKKEDGSVHSNYGSTPVYKSDRLLAFRDILVAISQKERFTGHGQRLTPADAIKVYMEHGAMRYWWHHVLWCQLGQALQLRYRNTDETQGAASNGRMRDLMNEIIQVWRLFMDMYGWNRDSISVPLSSDLNDLDDKASASEPFSSWFPKRQGKRKRDGTSVAAAMTLDCLKAAGLNVPMEIKRLFKWFFQTSNRDRSIATSSLLRAGVSSEVTEKALEGWESLTSPEVEGMPESTKKTIRSSVWKYTMDASQTNVHLDWGEKGMPIRLAELDGATKLWDTEFALNLWRQFQAHLQADKTENKTDSADQIYARFLRTFWALRRHEHAIGVWNHMINSGHLPTQKHWNAMLSGCTRAHDFESIRSIWANMLRSGTRADTDTWTTYIHGLIYNGKWEEGLNALENLGRIWKSAPPLTSPDTAGDTMTGTDTRKEKQTTETPEGHTVLRPALTPINAALSALVDGNNFAPIPRVLAWARSHQIPLSTFTFNILLRPIVRRGSQAAIQAHLQQMADANCAPDIVTFSIIINGLVSNPTSTFHTLPPETQESTIMSVLADMERQGIEPNLFTYGTILDGLLTPGSKELARDHTPNVPAARAVLAHMSARNIHPSPHIYTILVTHYFTRRPVPDLPAIASLWAAIRHSGQTYRMDKVFFDRVIEGYADHDEIEPALRFLRMVPELHGKSAGWRALISVLKALVRCKEWGLCAELVQDAEGEGGVLMYRQGRDGIGKGKTEFWELVDMLRERGLVGREDEER